MDIVRPTLLLDEIKCKANIRRIAEKARKAGVRLRPHFKTHQSREVARWHREEGIHSCTVSSIKMAAYFAADGWKDITVAFPLNFLEIDEINRIASGSKLNLLAVSPDSLVNLSKKLHHPVQCFIEIDTGHHRTGIDPANIPAIDEIISFISTQPLLTFKGFLSHAGQSYSSRSVAQIVKVHQEAVALMKKVGDHYRRDFPDLELSLGDTPTASVAEDFSGLQEIRPGNLIFYDVMQCDIGACSREQIAIAMACPVVAVDKERNEIVVHGGGVHFSKDFLKREDGSVLFGEVVKLQAKGWKLPPLPVYVKSLSQEHGVLSASPEVISKISVGDIVGILPVHACMTADAMGEYRTFSGKLIKMMPKTS